MATDNSLIPTHDSQWTHDEAIHTKFPKLTGNRKTQIAIVGAGVTGLSTAIELIQRGYHVTVLESQAIGCGTTGGSTGHVEAMPEFSIKKLVGMLGVEKAQQYIRYRLDAIDTVEHRSKNECDFQRVSGFMYSEHLKEKEQLQEERMAASSVGLITCWHDSLKLPYRSFGFEVKQMGRVHCMKYLQRLATDIDGLGGAIFERSHVMGVEGTSPTSVQVNNDHLEFDHIVFAVHSNYTDALRIYFQTPAYQSYVITARVRDKVPDALFWDTSDPYYYVRRYASNDPSVITVGGCDHRTGMDDPCKASDQLKQWLYSHFAVEEIIREWSAELFEPSDGMPIIGKVPSHDNVWVATGLSGIGWTLGPVAGKVIAQQIAGESVPLQEEFSPARFGLGGMKNLVAEQMASAGNYLERVLPSHTIKLEELEPGDGQVGNVDGEFVAVCRSKEGKLFKRDPHCVHMGGVVHWNAVEQTWDCPVHGGRYTHCGKRMYGPPSNDLKDSSAAE